MAVITITPAAENDLVNIWIYIARDNPDAADNVYRAAEETFQTLAAMPRLGAKYNSKRSRLKNLRFFPVSNFHNYVIYYQEQPDGIEIIRVLHAHMKKQERLKEDK